MKKSTFKKTLVEKNTMTHNKKESGEGMKNRKIKTIDTVRRSDEIETLEFPTVDLFSLRPSAIVEVTSIVRLESMLKCNSKKFRITLK